MSEPSKIVITPTPRRYSRITPVQLQTSPVEAPPVIRSPTATRKSKRQRPVSTDIDQLLLNEGYTLGPSILQSQLPNKKDKHPAKLYPQTGIYICKKKILIVKVGQ